MSGLRWMLIDWADVEDAEWHRVLASNKTHFLTWSRDYIWVRLMDEFISRVITTISLCILIVPEYSSHCIWILSSSLHSLFWDCQALLVWWERILSSASASIVCGLSLSWGLWSMDFSFLCAHSTKLSSSPRPFSETHQSAVWVIYQLVARFTGERFEAKICALKDGTDRNLE